MAHNEKEKGRETSAKANKGEGKSFQLHSNKWEKIYSRESGWLDDMKEFSFDPVTTDDLAGCDAAITLCVHLIARTGTIVLSS